MIKDTAVGFLEPHIESNMALKGQELVIDGKGVLPRPARLIQGPIEPELIFTAGDALHVYIASLPVILNSGPREGVVGFSEDLVGAVEKSAYCCNVIS